MDNELKLVLGKMLGETYRIQKEQGIVQVDDGRIFGLLNGFEEAIESEFDELEFISKQQIDIVADYFDPYWKEEKSIDEMPSFLQVRMDLEKKDITHARLINIFKYLKATDRFNTEIDKLGDYKLSNHDI